MVHRTESKHTWLWYPWLAFFKRCFDLKLVREFDSICFSARLKDDGLKFRGQLVNRGDGCFEEIGVDNPQALEVRSLEVSGKDDVGYSFDALNLLLHRKNNGVNGTSQVDP